MKHFSILLLLCLLSIGSYSQSIQNNFFGYELGYDRYHTIRKEMGNLYHIHDVDNECFSVSQANYALVEWDFIKFYFSNSKFYQISFNKVFKKFRAQEFAEELTTKLNDRYSNNNKIFTSIEHDNKGMPKAGFMDDKTTAVVICEQLGNSDEYYFVKLIYINDELQNQRKTQRFNGL